MCGIVGASSSFAEPKFDAALQSIEHRGPDERVIVNLPDMNFGFCRLAIVELAEGRQPLYLESESLMAMFNGEIYNYRELRDELTLEGVRFTGKSEIEVLLRGYMKWGDDLAPRLRGMFAIAIWDTREKLLVLIRDPLGKKPLYWFQQGENIGFASEIRALWKFIPFNRVNIDKESLVSFLISDSVPTPRSIDSRIRKVNPGTVLKLRSGSIDESVFWPQNFTYHDSNDLKIPSLFQAQLAKSVERRMISEVPIGMFLSSGMDSRAVASTLACKTKRQIQSFTVKFDSSYDESEDASLLAREFGFEHVVVDGSDEALAEAWDLAKEILDEPINDPAILPMVLLSKVASKYVKVAITGDGGDELFMGYPHFRLHEIPWIGSKRLGSCLRPLLKRVSDDGGYFGTGFKFQRLSRGLGINGVAMRDLAWRGGFNWNEVGEFLTPQVFDPPRLLSVLSELTRSFDQSKIDGSVATRLSWWYFRSYLMDTVLVKVDRASMAFGVECRSPLLDVDLVELVLSLRSLGKLKNFPRKNLLEQAITANGFKTPIKKRKHGMGIPVPRLLKTVLRDEFERLTNLDLIASQEIFQVDKVRRLKQALFDGNLEVRKESWALFTFQAWVQKYGDKLSPDL